MFGNTYAASHLFTVNLKYNNGADGKGERFEIQMHYVTEPRTSLRLYLSKKLTSQRESLSKATCLSMVQQIESNSPCSNNVEVC